MSEPIINLYSKAIFLSGKAAQIFFWFCVFTITMTIVIIAVDGEAKSLGGLIIIVPFTYLCRYWSKKASTEHQALAEKLYVYAKKSPYSGQSLYLAAKPRVDQWKDATERRQQLLDVITSRRSGSGVKVNVQGGVGWESLSGRELLLSLDSQCLFLTDLNAFSENSIPFNEVLNIEISGPGTTTTGGEFSGGGFGVQGFLVGAAASTVLNILTARTSTKTIVRIDTKGAEIFLLIDTREPDEVRLLLSPVYAATSLSETVYISNNNSQVDEILKLNSLRESGVISEDEFSTLKSRLLHKS